MLTEEIILSLKNPVVANHKAYGQELLPGLAYIDLIFQIFRKHNYAFNELELRNLTIYNPLIVGQDYHVVLCIECSEINSGHWHIVIEGQEHHKENLVLNKKRYITAEMYRRDPVQFEESIDINKIKESPKRIVKLEEVYELCRSQELIHTGFIKAEGYVYDVETAAIIEISVGQDALPRADGLMFHPALIDGSGIGSGVLISSFYQGAQGLFLPLFYESFRASALLQKQCITRVQASSIRHKKEILYINMEFFDESGQKVAELINLANKLVREPELINPLRTKTDMRSRTDQPFSPLPNEPASHDNNIVNTDKKSEVESFLKQLLADWLKKPVYQIETQIGYYEMGLNSPGLLEIVKAIENRINSPLPPTLLFEYTSIAELAAYLTENYASEFDHSTANLEIEQEWSPMAYPHVQADSSMEDGIAIIGMAGRYPEASNIQEFWLNLKEGKNCIIEIPKNRWDWHQFDGVKSPSGKNVSRWGGFIEDTDCFDPQFFRISPVEAEIMDPQERLFLEVCWEAIEDAGYTPKTLVLPRGPNKRQLVGVFVGVMHKDYTMIGAEAVAGGLQIPLSLNCAPIANRISYFCNFHGPSMAVDTVCSSSLTALHLALESIRRGECEAALAGGVNLSLHPNKYLSYGMLNFHSSDGYCHTFGMDGDGFVSGEGIGAVLLKPLYKAIQDRDHIYAVVKGSATNHGGTVSGISVPSPVGQADVIEACLEKTGIDPRTISYVEAHGTGTSLGDPIEIQGLVKAYRSYTQDKQFCSIGSVKSNIGHAESASGISGLTKTALQLYYKTLVPSLHSEEINPYIDFKQSPFYIQHQTEEWKQPLVLDNGHRVNYPRRAGLSSFGATGSNVHVILEEYSAMQTSKELIHGTSPAIVPLSAKDKERLLAYARKMLEFLKGRPGDMQTGQTKEDQEIRLKNMLEDKIKRIVSNIISVEEDIIDINQGWYEYGIDPVNTTRIKEEIWEELKIEIDLPLLIQNDSITSVTEYIISHHQDELETLVLLLAGGTGTVDGQESPIHPYNRDVELSKLAYTLQVGRTEMEERVVFIVNDLPELIVKLEAFVKGEENIAGCWKGQSKKSVEAINFLNADHDFLETIHKWIAKGKLKEIARLWVKGYEMDWVLLYGKERPYRVSLPTYPFAKERYWMPHAHNRSGSMLNNPSTAANIHPFVQQNTSNLSQQRFSSTFTGREFFMEDHVVEGQRVLPRVAYLEMAREAVNQAADFCLEGQTRIVLKNVVLGQPIVIRKQPAKIHIGLFPEENGEIVYEIYSEPEELDVEKVAYSHGIAVLRQFSEIPTLDVQALLAQCDQASFSSTQCYQFFSALGIEYDPWCRGIENIFIGKGRMLAKLHLPPSVAATRNQFVLHPSFLYSALQASAGLMMDFGKTVPSPGTWLINPDVALAMRKLEVFGTIASTMWAWVEVSNASHPGNEQLNIDLCDEQGNVYVRMKEITLLAAEIEGEDDSFSSVPAATSTERHSIAPPVGTLTLFPAWESNPVKIEHELPSSTERVVAIGVTDENLKAIKVKYPNIVALDFQTGDNVDVITKRFGEFGQIDHILWSAPTQLSQSPVDELLIEEQDQNVLQVFRIIKALLRLGYGDRKMGWTVITTRAQTINNEDPVNPTHAGIHGLIGSMVKEYPNWMVKLIDLEDSFDWPVSEIYSIPPDRRGRPWGYRKQEWYRQQLIPLQSPDTIETRYRNGGVYVVIGGAGGIGEAWSEYMIRKYQAKIIWIGRRKLNAAIQSKLDRLAILGTAPQYISADASDLYALQQAYEEIKQQYYEIHGVVHSAMVFSEHTLADMKEEQFKAGLSAKVNVCVRMSQVFTDTLDFIMFFSSLISFIKNPNQSHYASGCTFKDAFAYQLSRQWPCPVKIINWGYWGNPDTSSLEDYQLLSDIGLGLIEPEDGMKALETLLAGPVNQIALMKTTKALKVEGMNSEELITVYPGKNPINTRDMQKQVPEQRFQIKRIEEEMSRHIRDMDKLLCRLLWDQLQSMELFTGTCSIMDIKAKIGLPDRYIRWLEQSIAFLAQNNYLRLDEDNCCIADMAPVDSGTAWAEWDRQKCLWLENPSIKAWVVLVESTMRSLPAILTGKVPATDIMFPNSSMELVGGIYQQNLIADYFNGMLADIVAAYIREHLKQDPSSKIRIIEIGAGTGSTSVTVFKKLRPYMKHIQEYCYTDISKAFLIHAEKEYGPETPFLTCKMFNVEIPVAGQGIDAGGYDIVIAANVLHATKNIRQTLRNTKALLKGHGLVILNEMSINSLFAHLTFGLLEGWWLHEDKALRIPGCPGLRPETWQEVLTGEGFHSTFFPAHNAHELGQQIIVAQSDGLVRQKRTTETIKTPLIKKVNQLVLKEQSSKQNRAIKKTRGIPHELLRDKSTDFIKKMVGNTLKMPTNKIDSSEPLEKYGIDSILIVQLTNALRKELKNISSTLFFEYQTIDALVEHLMTTDKEALIQMVGMKDQEIPTDDETLLPSTQNIQPGYSNTRRFMQTLPDLKGKYVHPLLKEPIAIIGISGRYPQAKNLQEYWENIKAGKRCISEIPDNRWPLEGFYNPDPQEAVEYGKSYSKWGGFLEGFADFDPLFFNISPREAVNMDPQERLFIESCWEVLEDAGYTREYLKEKYDRQIGVFVGITKTGFDLYGPDLWKQGEKIFPHTSFGSVANRISYLLNLQGPSMPIDTMCSSSLTAIHEACEHIHRGECEMAIAGGVNLYVHSASYIGLCAKQMLSSNSQCAAFGQGGGGFVPGEGVGCVLLKTLSRAIQDGDFIYATILGSGINHSGKTNGYMVPNPKAQSDLILQNLNKTGIDPRTVTYVEAAALGSNLGDPIEVAALSKAFGQHTQDRNYCGIGSVKPNIGHLEAASGISQLTKVILQLQHKQLVPSIDAEPLNPEICFDETPFYLQKELQSWNRPVIEVDGKTQELPLRATISSFGAGGVNAHLIIEEYISPDDIQDQSITAYQIVVFSARNQERLQAVVRNMLEFLESKEDFSLSNLAYTLQVGREAMAYRLALVVSNQEELISGLKAFLISAKEDREAIDTPIPIFTGNLEGNYKGLKSIFTGREGEIIVEVLIKEKNLERIALYWTLGGNITWESLHEGYPVHRMPLPTYPFEKRNCWITQPAGYDILNNNESNNSRKEQVVALVSRLLGLAPGDVELNKPLNEYGFDSILLIQLLQQLKIQVDARIDLARLRECRSMQDIINIVPSQYEDEVVSKQQIRDSMTSRLAQFPELIHLNQSFHGQPVFWFHGGLGGVEVYQSIAEKVRRPFYGIQARGWMTNRSPLHGIQAMASYYVHIIQSVQHEGPYDLGGYSLGGTLAYEVTRQLQELGQSVNTLVMLDALDSTAINNVAVTKKTEILKAVNTALVNSGEVGLEKMYSRLIHRDELNLDTDDEEFLRQLVELARQRGLNKTEAQLLNQVEQNVKVIHAYGENFSVLPLPDPQGVTGYYFRNKSGLFLGELEPYFSIPSDIIPSDHINYWEEWIRQCPNLNIIDVDSPNHMMVISDKKSLETITAICEKLYFSEEPPMQAR